LLDHDLRESPHLSFYERTTSTAAMPGTSSTHRVLPQLLGVIPKNTGGFGAIGPAARMFVKNELEPLQHRFRELNEWIGEEVIAFEPYDLDGDNT
jgi:capsid portal protein